MSRFMKSIFTRLYTNGDVPSLRHSMNVVALLVIVGTYFIKLPSCDRHEETAVHKLFYQDDDPNLWNIPWEEELKNFSTPEETNFPLAFTIVSYIDMKQTLMLLRAIYRPQNVYCLHVDKKTSPEVTLLLKSWVKPIDNVFIIDQALRIEHSYFTTLEVELVCMRELLNRNKKWKYLINLTGQEYPRKTNLELVRILKTMNGSNLMNKMKLDFGRIRREDSVPHGLKIWKGALHIIVTRKFVEFALQDYRAIDLLNYLHDSVIPDESFFSTLNHNPQLHSPGGYPGEELTGVQYPYVNRLKLWSNEYNQPPCHGKFVRNICIWGAEDITTLTNKTDPSLYINKFIISINGDVYRIIDRWFMNRQKEIYANPNHIDLSFYEKHMPQRFRHF